MDDLGCHRMNLVIQKGFQNQIQFHSFEENDGSFSIIIYIKGFHTFTDIIEKLEEEPWESGEIKGNQINRVQRWYHQDGEDFGSHWKKSFPRWQSKEYSDWLLDLETDIQNHVNTILEEYGLEKVSFNSVLINKYRNGQDAFMAHKDDERIFGNNPTIVSLSFGETRQFVLKRSYYNEEVPKSCKLNKDEQNLNLTFDLEHGDILIMAGACQKYFCHELIKSDTELPRYNLTFRFHQIAA